MVERPIADSRLPIHLACRGRRLLPQLQPLQVHLAELSLVGEEVLVASSALAPGVLQVPPFRKEADFLRCPPVVGGKSAEQVRHPAVPYTAALQHLTSLQVRLGQPIARD